MALWPFGRKKRKAQQRADNEKSETEDDLMGIKTKISGPQGTWHTLVSPLTHSSKRTCNIIDPKLPSRKARESKPSSKQSSRKVSKSRDTTTTTPLPLPPPPPVPTPGLQSEEKGTDSTQPRDLSRQPSTKVKNREQAPPSAPFVKAHDVGSQTSIQPENFSATTQAPTLKAARSSTVDLARRKSSKRKADDKAREREIRSMTSPVPIPKRPRSLSNGPLARDTKAVPGGLDRRLSRPTSQVSLPFAASLRSSISGEMQHSFRVSAFDALAPRPTIRYSENPRRSSPAGGSRTSARKDKGPMIPEEDFSPRARIDKLADDMDASGLRELMDRDRRRKEKKNRSDREKLEKKLQRRLEKQKALLVDDPGSSSDVAMPDAPRLDAKGPTRPDQGPAAGTELGPDSRPPPPASPGSWLQDPSREHLVEPENPFTDPNQSHLDLGTDDEREEPVVQTAQAVRLSVASLSPPSSPIAAQHPRGPSGLSHVQSVSESLPLEDIPEPPSGYLSPDEGRRDSETSARAASSWRSLFRRGGTSNRGTSADKGRNTPSEFSNTSRESFARQNKQPPPVVQRSFAPKDGVPKRTRSKFREHLPELPISPPPSHVRRPGTPQSPRSPVSPTSPYIDHTYKVSTMDEQARVSTPLGDVHPAFREEVALSRGPSMRNSTPLGADDALLSQSLASVDSEGSWLSGRPQKRSSIPINPVRESVGSVSEQIHESDEPSEPYFGRRKPSPGKAPARSGLTSQFRPESSGNDGQNDEYEDLRQSSLVASPMEEPKYAVVHERRARLVQRAPAFKSREGLLDMFNAGEAGEDSTNVSPTTTSEASVGTPTETLPSKMLVQNVSLHRATSVDYGRGHTRKVAGSARLLDIPPRTSSDMKRSSVSSSVRGSPLLQSQTREHSEERPTAAAERPGVERFETAREEL
jgi:hypothetical protein